MTPPVPVLVAMPAPSRRNQVSTVKTDAPRPGAGPNVTNAFVPPKSIALFDGFESTVIVTVSLADSCAVVRRQLQDVRALDARSSRSSTAAAALPNVTVPGPLTFVHCVVTPTPGRPSSVTVPASDAVVGREREDLIGVRR